MDKFLYQAQMVVCAWKKKQPESDDVDDYRKCYERFYEISAKWKPPE